jgi:hypothetical protein
MAHTVIVGIEKNRKDKGFSNEISSSLYSFLLI